MVGTMFCFGFSSCSSNDDNDDFNYPKERLYGTWKISEVKMSESSTYITWPMKETTATFNSDGTGVYNGQDTIDFTWDAENKFIMINDGKHPFELNNNCLTVEEFHGIEEYYKQ